MLLKFDAMKHLLISRTSISKAMFAFHFIDFSETFQVRAFEVLWEKNNFGIQSNYVLYVWVESDKDQDSRLGKYNAFKSQIIICMYTCYLGLHSRILKLI